LLAEWHTTLKHDGLHGRPRQDATRRKLVEVVQLAWAWLYDNDESDAAIPPPRKIRMVREPAAPTVAPTWAEMDACIAELRRWQRDLAVLLRFTGLRVQQAMSLTWDDVDLRARCMRVRGELGKSPQERRGRVVPVSGHLVDELGDWPVGDEPWLVLSKRQRGNDRERMARARDFRRAWERAGVREDVWRGRPHHSFRKGFVSELRRSGADADAVEFLVGHSLGLRGIYTDPSALPLRATVDLIPPVAKDLARAELEREDQTQPRFEGLDPNDPRPIREITLDDCRRDDRSLRCPTRVPRRQRRRGNVVFIDTWRKNGGGDGILTHAVFDGNEAGTDGGAVFAQGSSLTFDSVIVTANEAATGGGMYLDGPQPIVGQSNAWDNQPDDYYGMIDPTGLYGNLSVDPDFLDPTAGDLLDRDYHLSETSPCIDAGDPALFDPDGSVSDMGAYGGGDAGSWDLDVDGYDEWWQPGEYDAVLYPGDGWDCDDHDDDVHPGSGC